MVLRDALGTVLLLSLVGLVLFSLSGLWPPLVAIESGSMEPEMSRGDMVFIAEEHRYAEDYAHADTGVVTVTIGATELHREFGGSGDVIVYRPNGHTDRTPIIHRAHFWVNGSENWYSKANPAFIEGNNCTAIPNCPAPHEGFITKGDANAHYDQVIGHSGPVRPEWVIGTAEVRIPYIGYVRLVLR
jgi:signal peptidase